MHPPHHQPAREPTDGRPGGQGSSPPGTALRVLAIDTGLPTGSVAAVRGGRRAERSLPTPGDHARLVAAHLAAAAGDLGWRIADADVVAVVRGPGSFTGLRVGVTTAKAIAWASGCALVSVSGFEVVAAALQAAGERCLALEIAFDAGRGDVSAATAVRAAESPTGWSIGPATIRPAIAWLASLADGAVVAGPAIGGLAALCPSRPGIRVAESVPDCTPAAHAAGIALARLAAGGGDDPATLVPDYSRPSYAEERRPEG